MSAECCNSLHTTVCICICSRVHTLLLETVPTHTKHTHTQWIIRNSIHFPRTQHATTSAFFFCVVCGSADASAPFHLAQTVSYSIHIPKHINFGPFDDMWISHSFQPDAHYVFCVCVCVFCRQSCWIFIRWCRVSPTSACAYAQHTQQKMLTNDWTTNEFRLRNSQAHKWIHNWNGIFRRCDISTNHRNMLPTSNEANCCIHCWKH